MIFLFRVIQFFNPFGWWSVSYGHVENFLPFCKFSLKTNSGWTKAILFLVLKRGGAAKVKTPCGYDRFQRLYDNGQVSLKRRALPVGKEILPLPEVRILKSGSKVLIGFGASLTFV